MNSQLRLYTAVLLGILVACTKTQAISPGWAPPAQPRDMVFFVHYETAAIPLACHIDKQQEFARGVDCLAVVPQGAPILVEGDGTSPSRPFSETCYDEPVHGLVAGQRAPPVNGYSVWPPQGVQRVKRIAVEEAYMGGGGGMPGRARNLKASDPDADQALTPAEKTVLAQAGRKALNVPDSDELYIKQVVSLDLDHDGRKRRLIALAFHEPLGPDPTNDQLRNSSESILFHAGIFLMDEKVAGKVQLLRRHSHTILATVDLAGDERIALWLDGSGHENLRYSLELFQHGKLLPLGCFGCGPGNGLTTTCIGDR